MKKLLMAVLAGVILTASAAASVEPYLYSVTQYGADVTARLTAPEGGLLVLAVYDRAARCMTDCRTQVISAGEKVQYETVVFSRMLESTEYVKGFLLDTDTGVPLCSAVLSDYVIPSS